MTCDAIRNLFSAFLEGELEAGDRARVERHLAGCPDCRDLLALMDQGRTAWAPFPEVPVGPALLARLYAIPERRRPFFVRLTRVYMPKLQPALAVLSAVLIVVSMYAFHPDRKQIDRAVSRQVHLAYGSVEKLFVRAEGLTGRLGEWTANVLDTVKSVQLTGGDEERTK
jgi:anti-sigma factor RsiW